VNVEESVDRNDHADMDRLPSAVLGRIGWSVQTQNSGPQAAVSQCV